MRRDRSILKTWFEKGDKPTQSQFADLIDSMFNLDEDSYLLANISNYDSTKIYSVSNLVIYLGSIWTCVIDGSTGTFQLDNWNRLPNKNYRYASVAPAWQLSTSYVVGNLITINGLIYNCVLNHTSSTSNTPPNITCWSLTTVTDGSITSWSSGLYLLGDIVFLGRNFYKCNVTSLLSSNFSTELSTSKWKTISNLEGWQQITSYFIGDTVTVGTTIYQALVNHTSSNSFSTDIANWQAFGSTGSTIYTQKFTVASSSSPWVFTLTTPYPSSVIGFILNGRYMDIPADVTQTGSNGEIFTWASSEGGLEIGDKIQIKYI